ncbi:hypothetical protein RM533_12540 [Croceicoccus sp. F390]|uniref:Uncharacterized protein n=1 Tax=Croceicoccus esteveae TaxID=3075597 RepID=A0ABU2ZL95_9SPHN|nr:hypothetical protein [Croceicoccus sp. F390]MDT0576996.1 hypothetical protein [Croceicoccus sp. F390]
MNLPGPSNDRLRIYRDLMEELKLRVNFVICLPQDISYPDLFRFELCQVQVRKVCEIIAIGCLSVHDEFSNITADDLAIWTAPDIFKKLKKVNSNYFPEAVNIQQTRPSQTTIFELKNSYLSKVELVKVHGRSGNYLHRGSLKRLLGGENWHPEVDFRDAVAFCHKVKETLSPYHRISVRDDKSVAVLCKMHDPECGNQVSVDVINMPPARATAPSNQGPPENAHAK